MSMLVVGLGREECKKVEVMIWFVRFELIMLMLSLMILVIVVMIVFVVNFWR